MTVPRATNPPPPYRAVSAVLPGLLMGARPPPGPVLRSLGIGLLVLCAGEHQPPASAFPGVEVIRVPLTENEPVAGALAAACGAARRVATHVARRGVALVTCSWGYNRSGLVTGLALRLLRPDWPGDVVVARLRAVRPPCDGKIALGIPAYEQAVRRGCP